MNLRFSPRLASAIIDRCAGRPLWEIDLDGVLSEVIGANEAWEDRVPVALGLKYPLSQFLGTYLSALIIPNSSEDLVSFGSYVVGGYAAEGDVNSLVALTNYVFKRLTLCPVSLGDENFHQLCVDVNFQLHVSANLSIHPIRASSADYYQFSREIDTFIEKMSSDKLPKSFCFVFLTDSYVDNFDLWIDTFNSSNRSREHLLIIAIGPGVQERVRRKLNAIRFANATIREIFPSRAITVCGNGEDLYYLWYLKIRIVRHFVSTGHNLIYSDLDSFWLKDFFPFWEGPGLSDLDIVFMPATDMPPYAVRKWGAIPCAGFFACRASERLTEFLGRWEEWVEVMFDDQIGLAQMLLDCGVEWQEQRDAPDWRRVVWDPRLIVDPTADTQVKFGILNPALARRVGTPDLSTVQGAAIWHPRWIDSKEEHSRLAAALVSLAGSEADRPQVEQRENALLGARLKNLALGKPATQSSMSEWSRGLSREEDASGANNGQISGEAGFHTDGQVNPWWQVDLGEECVICYVVIFNRQHYAERLANFRVMKSLDGEKWQTIFRKVDGQVFGDQAIEPFTATPDRNHLARYLRVQIDGWNFLHFSECQVFGYAPDEDSRRQFLNEAAVTAELFESGRNGCLADVGGFSIFADFDRYAAPIVEALTKGSYEWTERSLTRELLRHGDRVIELGTAVGAVAMTAAAIVGAENVLTFEANPYVLEDARKNFDFNGFKAITARNGMVRNRLGYKPTEERVSFYISKQFWASRLSIKDTDSDIIETVQVPIFCLEEEIRAHNATVLICDIEGGEVELFTNGDLSGIRLIIMETHYWSAGVAETDAMIRQLIGAGFNIDLARSAHQVVALRRELP